MWRMLRKWGCLAKNKEEPERTYEGLPHNKKVYFFFHFSRRQKKDRNNKEKNSDSLKEFPSILDFPMKEWTPSVDGEFYNTRDIWELAGGPLVRVLQRESRNRKIVMLDDCAGPLQPSGSHLLYTCTSILYSPDLTVLTFDRKQQNRKYQRSVF